MGAYSQAVRKIFFSPQKNPQAADFLKIQSMIVIAATFWNGCFVSGPS